jgi:hypothetical protein
LNVGLLYEACNATIGELAGLAYIQIRYCTVTVVVKLRRAGDFKYGLLISVSGTRLGRRATLHFFVFLDGRNNADRDNLSRESPTAR